MIIRKLIESDIESLAALYEEFWGEKSNVEKMKSTYDNIKDNENYLILNI